MKNLKVHLFHPVIAMTPACRPQLTGKEFKAVDFSNGVTCKHCLHIIATNAFYVRAT